MNSIGTKKDTGNPRVMTGKAAEIAEIFRPGTKVDIVFNVDSLTPVIRTTTLYECRYDRSEMLLLQTKPQILPSFKYTKMDITTIVRGELNERSRYGVQSKIIEFIKNYQLSDAKVADSLLIAYSLPLQKVNIRTAYRFEPSSKLEIMGKIIYQDHEYIAGRDYKIHNISITGIGILVPKKVQGKVNLLQRIGVDESAIIELDLVDFSSKDRRMNILAEIHIVRKNVDYNLKSGFMGIKFSLVDPSFENILSKFIHEAQLYERRLAAKLL